jgi:hypothetical protein
VRADAEVSLAVLLLDRFARREAGDQEGDHGAASASSSSSASASKSTSSLPKRVGVGLEFVRDHARACEAALRGDADIVDGGVSSSVLATPPRNNSKTAAEAGGASSSAATLAGGGENGAAAAGPARHRATLMPIFIEALCEAALGSGRRQVAKRHLADLLHATSESDQGFGGFFLFFCFLVFFQNYSILFFCSRDRHLRKKY